MLPLQQKKKKKGRQNTASPSPMCNIHIGTDLGIQLVIAGRLQDRLR